MTTLVICVLITVNLLLLYLFDNVRQELIDLKAECETMFHRDPKTGRIAKGRRKS